MAFFVHKETGALHPDTPRLLEEVARRVEAGGIEAWQSLDPAQLLGADAQNYEKNRDTLDVWFDSGTTHATVLGGPGNCAHGTHADQTTWPADMYLEGSDQHRGWFHSSLLTGCMMYGRAPYNSLLTHGFVVDGAGRKMSKSVGNVIAPQKVSDSLGAEILRLWVASTDYSGELSISDEILKRVVEGYRRIRNTLRFLLANVADFDPARDSLAVDDMLEIDRYALAMTAQMQAEVVALYDRYDFHPSVARLQTFCSEDLGAFYLDVLKDRLYTSAPRSRARRSAQTVLLHITQTLLKLLAPILSFTTEEAWAVLCNTTLASTRAAGAVTIFTETYQSQPAQANAPALLARWARLREIRGQVMRKLEELRSAGSIGSSLQGEVDLRASGDDLALLRSVVDQLAFIFIVSRATVHEGAGDLEIGIVPSPHQKCERCWHYKEDVGQHANHPQICGRCVASLEEAAGQSGL